MKKIFFCFFLTLCLHPAFSQDSIKQNLIVVDLEGGVAPAITNKLSVFRLRLRLRLKETAHEWFVLALESLHYTPPNRPKGFVPSGLIFASEPKNLVFTVGLGARYTLLERPTVFRLSLEDGWVLGQYTTHEFVPIPASNSSFSFSFGGTHKVISKNKVLYGNKMGLALELIPFKYVALQGSCLANLNTQRSYLAWTVGLCFGVLK